MLPTLSTPRLVLRPALTTDLDALHALWTDADVRRYLFDDRVIARDHAEATLGECHALGTRGLGLWIVAAPAPGERLLGCAGLLPVSVAAQFEPRLAGLVEPLVALAPDAWGRGYAREALLALLAYATGTLGLRQLAGVTDVPNGRSDRMLRSVGFEPLSEVSGPVHQLRTYLWQAS